MTRGRRWTLAQVAVVGGVLFLCATAYRPGLGLTRLIGFTAAWHDRELPAVRAVPHDDDAGAGYDGRCGAQMAVDPLLRDPAIDTALDTPVFRAHRILLSWIAWGLGFGRPELVLHVYAVLNILAWGALAWLLTRWIRVRSWKTLVLWAGGLLSYGALASVRYSLTDLPATLAIAASIVTVERGSRVAGALLAGVAGLTRETALVMCVVFAGPPWWPVRWRPLVVSCVIAVAPLLLWYGYLAATHDWRVLAGAGNIGLPFVGFVWKLREIARMISERGLDLATVATIAGLVGFVAQGVIAVRALASGQPAAAWPVVATAFFVFALCVQVAPWDETPGAYLRIALPLTVGANVVLASRSAVSWRAILLVNAGVCPSLLLRF
jgi:hypothetical protein